MTPNVRFAAGLALLTCAAAISGARAQAPRDSQGSPVVTFQVEVDYVDVDVVMGGKNVIGGIVAPVTHSC
jgi:hypothetical protein